MWSIKRFFLIWLLTPLVLNSNTLAEDNNINVKPKAKLRDPAEFQKIIDEYKDYVAKIPAEIREEIISYRKEVAKLNKQKRMLYKRLSQAGQNYLQKEQEYKKRLPLDHKSLISVEQLNEEDKNEEHQQ